jgi:hypothetical protein
LLEVVLVDGVDQQERLSRLLLELLEHLRYHDGVLSLTGDPIDALLSGFHALDVLVEGRELLWELCGVET